jgi:hypothetical protein
MKYRATLTIELEVERDAFQPFATASGAASDIAERIRMPDGYGSGRVVLTRSTVSSLVALEPERPVVDPSRSTPNL